MFNNKPINIEAQRVQKVIQETQRKLSVLAMLNEEFFSELRNKDDAEVINIYGPQVGKYMIRHALLEEDFNTNCLENGANMYPLDYEDLTEEQRTTILNVATSTNKLVRIFSTDDEMFKKL